MAGNYRKQIKCALEEYSAEREVNLYLELFPEFRGRLSKFVTGVFQWDKGGEINIGNPDDVSRVRMILKVLDSSPAFDFFDQSFNECSPEVVCKILGMSPKIPKEEPEIEFNYTVYSISDFEEAKQYHNFVSWCIVISKEAFEEYTKSSNRFYFLGNSKWRDEPCRPGKNFPYDNYGYSLIAVEMSSDNKIVSVTSRWNEYSEKFGNFLNAAQIKNILKEKYNRLLK